MQKGLRLLKYVPQQFGPTGILNSLKCSPNWLKKRSSAPRVVHGQLWKESQVSFGPFWACFWVLVGPQMAHNMAKVRHLEGQNGSKCPLHDRNMPVCKSCSRFDASGGNNLAKKFAPIQLLCPQHSDKQVW